jgi:hypothetical protein
MRIKRVLLGLCLVLASKSLAFAQAGYTGSFNGRVVDQGEAVITGATVTATNTGTGVVRTTTTNSDGLYSMTALPPGTYDVKTDNAGFAPSSKKGVTLPAGSTLTLDFTMGVAGTTQSIEVSEVAPLVETTQSIASAELQHAEVQELPMLNRTVGALINLTPGVREETAVVGVAGTATVHVYFNVGGNGRSSQVLVDGTDNHDEIDAGATMQYTLEGIEEFKILTHGFSSEYGRSGGAVVSLVTKSGTNKLHGSAFGYGRSDAMTKIDYFADPAHGGIGKAPYSRKQFGASIGGPIIKDRAWYAGSIERIDQQYSTPVPSRITALENLLVPLNLNVVPATSIPQPFNDILANAKADFKLSNKHSMFFRYALEHANLTNSNLNESRPFLKDASGKTLTENDINRFYTSNYAATETWLINNTTINQFSWQFLWYQQHQYGIDCGPKTTASYGPTLGLGLEQCLLRKMTFPTINTAPALYTGGITNRDVQKWQFRDDLSKQIGKHSLKGGLDFVYVPSLGAILTTNAGTVSFFHDPDVILNSQAQWVATPGTCTKAFVSGTTIDSTHCGPYSSGFQTPGAVKSLALVSQSSPPTTHAIDTKYAAAYVNDDYKVTPRLTLNLGLRYDFFYNMDQPEIKKNRIYKVLQDIGSPFGGLPHASTLDFSPRVGFAWDIGGNAKNVVRASYGIFYPTQVATSYFQQIQFQKDVIFFTQTTQDPSPGCTFNPLTGACPLGGYVFGVTPLGSIPAVPNYPPANVTTLPVGASISSTTNASAGWYDPNLKDQYEQISHVGYTRQFGGKDVISADFTHILGIHEWRPLDINPLCTTTDPAVAKASHIPLFQGPCKSPGFAGAEAAPGARILSTATLAKYGDANLLGPMSITASVGRSHFDELAIAYQHRGTRATLQASYVLSRGGAFGANVGGLFVNGSAFVPEIPSAYGGCVDCAGEYGPGLTDQRHRFTMSGIIKVPLGFEVAPSLTVGSALPYQQFRANSPSGDGALRCFVGPSCTTADPVTNPNGVEVGINAARGQTLVNLSSRISRAFKIRESMEIKGFVELYNIPDRANFGSNFGPNAFAPATFNKPTGYIGGPGSASTVPNSFQVQLGARFSF